MKINYLIANFWGSTVMSLWCTVLIYLTSFANVVLDVGYEGFKKNSVRLDVEIHSIKDAGGRELNFAILLLIALAIFMGFFAVFMLLGTYIINYLVSRGRQATPLLFEDDDLEIGIPESINSDYY